MSTEGSGGGGGGGGGGKKDAAAKGRQGSNRPQPTGTEVPLGVRVSGTVKKWLTEQNGKKLPVQEQFGFVRADVDQNYDIFVHARSLANRRSDGMRLSQLDPAASVEMVVKWDEKNKNYIAINVDQTSGAAAAAVATTKAVLHERPALSPEDEFRDASIDTYRDVLWRWNGPDAKASKADLEKVVASWEEEDWISRRTDYKAHVHNLRTKFAGEVAVQDQQLEKSVSAEKAVIASARAKRQEQRERDRAEMAEWQERIAKEQGLERDARVAEARKNFELQARIRVEKIKMVVAEQRALASTFIDGDDAAIEAMIVDQIDMQMNYNQALSQVKDGKADAN